MLIGEVVSKTGLSRDTIRFYERKGLIQVGRTDSEWNNYKDYNRETLDKLLLVKRAKGFGFTLNEISEILELVDANQATCETLAVKVKEKLSSIDEKIKELRAMKAMICDKIQQAGSKCSTGLETNCASF